MDLFAYRECESAVTRDRVAGVSERAISRDRERAAGR